MFISLVKNNYFASKRRKTHLICYFLVNINGAQWREDVLPVKDQRFGQLMTTLKLWYTTQFFCSSGNWGEPPKKSWRLNGRIKNRVFNKYSTTEEKNIPQCNKCNLEDINIKIWISGGESFHIAELNNEHKKTKKELSRFSATVRLFVIYFER